LPNNIFKCSKLTKMICKHLKHIHLVPADSQRYNDRLNATNLRALEIQYGLLDYIKNSQVFTDESIQREVKYLQSPDRLHVSWDQGECFESILLLMLTMNVDEKHRKELRTILNKTSQDNLVQYLSGYDCKLIFEIAYNYSSFNSILVML